LCRECVRRLEKNPLRVLDCKIDSPGFTDIPQISSCLCGNCKSGFDLLQSLLKSVDCSYIVDEKLVRGLDYYTQTVFEIRSNAVGAQDALAAGGRYDNLVEELGGYNTPAVGFALGSERVLIAAHKASFFDSFNEPERICIAVADQKLFNKAFSFAVKIGRDGIKGSENISVFGPVERRSLTSQLKFADKIGASKTVIFAATEFEEGRVLIKNMRDKTQAEVLISEL